MIPRFAASFASPAASPKDTRLVRLASETPPGDGTSASRGGSDLLRVRGGIGCGIGAIGGDGGGAVGGVNGVSLPVCRDLLRARGFDCAIPGVAGREVGVDS